MLSPFWARKKIPSVYYPQAYKQSGHLNVKISFTQIITPLANRPTFLGQKWKTKLVLSTNQKNITVKLDHRPICINNKKKYWKPLTYIGIWHIFTYTYPSWFFSMLNSLGKDTPWRILWPHVVSNPRRIFKALCLDGINGFSTTTDHLSWGSRHDPPGDIQKSLHSLRVSTCFKTYLYIVIKLWKPGGIWCERKFLLKRKSLKTRGSDSL